MGQQNRSMLYNALKAHGWEPDQRYSSYSEDALRTLAQEQGLLPDEVLAQGRSEREAYQAQVRPKPAPIPEYAPTPQQQPSPVAPSAPRSNVPDPDELPGQRLNHPVEVIRVDDQGLEWYQEEVRKPAYPKPRGRRVLTYLDPGVKTETIQSGEYVETFEVSGNRLGRSAEVKVTLPSYQVGIYKDPRFPFKIHIYNDRTGFNLHEVEDYFGGADMVPRSCKRIYIENDMCYDIRTVIQTIDAMYRELILRGKA